MKIDTTVLQTYVDQKLISVQKHPTADLFIYNYTQKCQFDRVWNDITMQCRGLILEADGTIHSRPFKKFFNVSEHDGVLPESEPYVHEKMDGSLGISYFIEGRPFIATRGSFKSDQAMMANELLQSERYYEFSGRMNPGLTYLFEIIYPENRIVVNYGDRAELVLLAVINTETGEEQALTYYANHIATPKQYEYSKLPKDLENAEGFVFHWPNENLRLKMKFEEYVRLHRLITGVNKRRIWDMLRHNQPLDELLERVPDEFYAWVKKMIDELSIAYGSIEQEAQELYRLVSPMGKDRKGIALRIKGEPTASIVFSMLDGKPYEDKIWNQLRPAAEQPFKIVEA